jgi:SHS2 domain-containing protein
MYLKHGEIVHSMSYKYIDHTADMEMIAEAESLEKLFLEAAKGMYGIMLKMSKVEQEMSKVIEITQKRRENLLHDFLDELLYLLETENLVFSGFQMRITGSKLRCVCKGEKFDSVKHEEGSLVKAVTYNKLKIWKKNKKFLANIVFDM